MKFKIKTENGELKRVTVEHAVSRPEPLYDLQDQLSAQLPQFTPKRRDDLHMTLFHFGKPEDLYKEIVRERPELEFKLFLDRFYDLLGDTYAAVPEGFKLQALSLTKFGSKREPTVVVELEHLEPLDRAHDRIREQFREFFADCGVGDYEEFIDRHPYLHNQIYRQFKPHVSLGRLDEDVKLPYLDVSGLVIELKASHLRNVEIV